MRELLNGELRNPPLGIETYKRMAYMRLRDWSSPLSYVHLIIPVSLRDEMVKHFEDDNYSVLPQWIDGIDEHEDAILLTIWRDSSVDVAIPVKPVEAIHWSEPVRFTMKSAINPFAKDGGSISLGH